MRNKVNPGKWEIFFLTFFPGFLGGWSHSLHQPHAAAAYRVRPRQAVFGRPQAGLTKDLAGSPRYLSHASVHSVRCRPGENRSGRWQHAEKEIFKVWQSCRVRNADILSFFLSFIYFLNHLHSSCSRRSNSICKSPGPNSHSKEMPLIARDIGRSESLRSPSSCSHRIFRPCDLIHGEVLGKGFFGQAIKVSITAHTVVCEWYVKSKTL